MKKESVKQFNDLKSRLKFTIENYELAIKEVEVKNNYTDYYYIEGNKSKLERARLLLNEITLEISKFMKGELY